MIDSADETVVDDEYAEETGESAEYYVSLARAAHEEAETFLQQGLYKKWRRNYALSQSEHPDDSKYNSEAFKHRSKTFRGKTEASIRKNEAAAAISMFSSMDVVSIEASNRGDEKQMATAKIVHQLVNSRLDNSIKWFLLSIGGYHEAMISGNVCSEQYWSYERTPDGEVVLDQPEVILYPPENVKLSPHANWLDPVHSSPYVVLEVPMFLDDIKARMEKNGGDWIDYEDSAIAQATATFKHDQVKTAREGKEQTTAKETNSRGVRGFDLIFVHKNFIRVEGKDLFYFTLGTELLLSEPVPVHEAYPHLKKGQRPIVWGTATIQPHKVHSRSLVDRVAGSQIQSNEISNLRFDNVRQALNKRKYVQRNMGVDYRALTRSVPGGAVLMDDINAVKPEDTPDVTGSSYQEQHMINADFDDLAGSFSTASVSTNRQLNDTVGGMQLLSGNANTLTEYQLRVIVETWIEVVLRQLVDMVLFYEDDEVIKTVTGLEGITNESLRIPLSVRVSVGFGSTDPQQKVNKLGMGIQMVSSLPGMAQRLDGPAISEEIFGLIGHSDSKKFIREEEEDPRVAELMQQVQQLTQIIQTEQAKEQIRQQGQIAIEAKRGENQVYAAIIKATNDRQIRFTEMAINQNMKVQDIEAKAGANASSYELGLLKEVNRMRDIQNKKDELLFKQTTGQEGI